MHIYRVLLAFFLLSSCGGGSSSSDNQINPPTIQPPSLTNETCLNTQVTGLKRCNLVHDSIERFYYIYEPPNLDTNSSIAVLFALHGYGSSAMTHFNYTNYEPIADANNFLVVYPQGTTNNGLNTHWNNGGWTSKSTAKDIEFIDTVIDYLKQKISIDETRIYSSGMSNGGYMSYHLACNLDNTFAAVVSVTGSMTNDTFDSCSPSHPTAAMQIHGIQDVTVPYLGSGWSKSIDDVINYWVNYNSCDNEPERLIKYSSQMGLINFDTYSSCLNNVNVKLILHPEMGHNWPYIQNYNIDASQEIWDFVSKYDLYGLRN